MHPPAPDTPIHLHTYIIPTPYLHPTYTQCLHPSYTLPTPYLNPPYTLPRPYPHPTYTLSASFLPTPYLFPSYTLLTPYLHPTDTITVHPSHFNLHPEPNPTHQTRPTPNPNPRTKHPDAPVWLAPVGWLLFTLPRLWGGKQVMSFRPTEKLHTADYRGTSLIRNRAPP